MLEVEAGQLLQALHWTQVDVPQPAVGQVQLAQRGELHTWLPLEYQVLGQAGERRG